MNQQLVNLMNGANVPEESQEEFVQGFEMFSWMLVYLLEGNKDIAPNYITFSLGTEEGKYALTIKRCEGTSPAENISQLEETVVTLQEALKKAGYEEPSVEELQESAIRVAFGENDES